MFTVPQPLFAFAKPCASKVSYIHTQTGTYTRAHPHTLTQYVFSEKVPLFKKKNMSAEEINFCHTNHIKVVCFALLHISYIFHYD